MQALLFGGGEPAVDRGFGRIVREVLSEGAWIEQQSGWLAGHQEVFECLVAQTRWREERRWMYEREVAVPRLCARLPEDGPGHPLLWEARDVLSARYGWDLNRVGCNYYRDGRDSVAEHGDRMGALRANCVIAIVSLGEPRALTMRPVGGGASRRFELGWGDLFVMGGNAQESWLHGVPKRPWAGPRISVQFRPGGQKVSAYA